jgi:hypothetical protein
VAILASTGALAPGVAAATHRDSVRIVLAAHIRVGEPTTIQLVGFAAQRASVELYSQPRRCPRTLTAEFKVSDVKIWVGGRTVDGHYSYRDPVSQPASTRGPQWFCAYLSYSDSGATTTVTAARESLRFRIPR